MKNAWMILALLLIAIQGDALSAQSKAITQQEFNETLEFIEKAYLDRGIPKAHNHMPFGLGKHWDNPNTWFSPIASGRGRGQISVPGGVARRIKGGVDTLTLAICRELGYLFAGYPARQRVQSGSWVMANSGNSIYYATFVCATLLWQDQHEQNAAYRATVAPKAKAFCDGVYPESSEAQNLCYRKVTAAVHLSTYANRDNPVSFDEPSTTVRDKTLHKYPPGQCQFDTYLAGIACKAYERWDHHSHPANDADIAKVSCATSDYPTDPAETIRQGLRPRCWYAPPAGR